MVQREQIVSVLYKIESRFEGYLAMFMLVAYSMIIMYDVLLRVFFSQQTLWGLTVILGAFAWVCWLSAALALRTSSHLRFTLVRQKLSNRLNYLFSCIETILWVAIFGIVFYYSIPQLEQRIASGVTVSGTNFPRYLLYASVPVGTGLIIVRATQQLYHVTKKYKNGDDITPDAQI